MKTKLNFTKGEWMAAVALLLVIVSSYLFYFFYPNSLEASVDVAKYATAFEAFEKEQQLLRDSMQSHRYDRYKPFLSRDTTPGSNASKVKRDPMHGIVRLDLNKCDSIDMMLMPGVGEKRAALIYKYREKLGGFVSFDQLREVFGMQDFDVNKVGDYFTLSKESVHRIPVNEAEYKDLVAHPYVDAYMAKCILVYRKKYGRITSMSQLQEVTHAYPELIRKLEPYFIF